MGGDFSAQVLEVMKEIAKTNKFLHKNDMWTSLQRKMNNQEFETAL